MGKTCLSNEYITVFINTFLTIEIQTSFNLFSKLKCDGNNLQSKQTKKTVRSKLLTSTKKEIIPEFSFFMPQ